MKEMLLRLIGEDIELTADIQPGLGKIKADSGQIEQVILNLIVNSRDAMPTGGRVLITTRNLLDAEVASAIQGLASPGSYVMLAVKDTGSGIPEAIRNQIFEPFFTTKETGKGTGLGLATVYGVVQQTGGYVSVESTPGEGTTFRIFLPRFDDVVDISDRGTALPVSAEAAPSPRTRTILLVEDDDSVRSLASAILSNCGYQVLQGRDGAEALRVSENFSDPIDALVTDVVMPQMSGRQLAEVVQKLRPGIRVLYLSGYTDDVIIKHGVLDSGTAFLQKPFTPAALSKKVQELLAQLSVPGG
jgi:CheY-like chemotaxis protein